MCPWARELLDGMLGNNLLGFHAQQHCNNFLETVDRCLESRTCWERFKVSRSGRTTSVRPFPISVDPDLADQYLDSDWEERIAAVRLDLNLGNRPLIVGVDRVDYTKGIPERLRALDAMLTAHPEWRDRFHFVQVGAPSRTNLSTYRSLNEEVNRLADGINRKHGASDWKPVLFLNEHCGPELIFALYREAAGCVVSSLHDGMNLVAKEFVSARADEQGVLVLSEFTGAARQLKDAVIVNPFDVEHMAAAMHSVLTMPADEQRRRMRRLRAEVADNNIFRWAGTLLSEAGKLVEECPAAETWDDDAVELLWGSAQRRLESAVS